MITLPFSPRLIAIALALCPILFAQEDQALLEVARDPQQDFLEAYEKAKANGVGDAALAEARFVNMLVTQNIEGLIGFASKMEEQLDAFDVGFGKTFVSRAEAQGYVDTLKAIQDYRRGDWESFMTHYVTAFVNAPIFAQNVGLAQILNEQQYKLAMDAAAQDVTIPMDMVIANVEGEAKSIREWLGNDKALLLDFWASWCGPCIRLMPELKAKAESLSTQGIFVAAMNTDDDDQIAKAENARQAHGMQSVNWLIDPNGSELSSLLFVNSIPRMILVSPEGEVLYNGHPTGEELDTALASIGVSLPDSH